jgi:hypothetical protein
MFVHFTAPAEKLQRGRIIASFAPKKHLDR